MRRGNLIFAAPAGSARYFTGSRHAFAGVHFEQQER
jgi:hypothetical protein